MSCSAKNTTKKRLAAQKRSEKTPCSAKTQAKKKRLATQKRSVKTPRNVKTQCKRNNA